MNIIDKVITAITVTFAVLSAILAEIIWLAGGCLHLYTVLIAYFWSGFWGAVITFIFPVISTIYWFVKMWNAAGTFWNFYCVVVSSWTIVFAIVFLIVPFALAWMDDRIG